MAIISGVSEDDMVELLSMLEKAGLNEEAVASILRLDDSLIRHELATFLLSVSSKKAREEACAGIMRGPWADWPGVTG